MSSQQGHRAQDDKNVISVHWEYTTRNLKTKMYSFHSSIKHYKIYQDNVNPTHCKTDKNQ